MDTNAKCKQVTEDLHSDATRFVGKLGKYIDSTDKTVYMGPEGYTFRLYENVDEQTHRKHLGGRRPVGQFVHTVTVTTNWVPYDDESTTEAHDEFARSG